MIAPHRLNALACRPSDLSPTVQINGLIGPPKRPLNPGRPSAIQRSRSQPLGPAAPSRPHPLAPLADRWARLRVRPSSTSGRREQELSSTRRLCSALLRHLRDAPPSSTYPRASLFDAVAYPSVATPYLPLLLPLEPIPPLSSRGGRSWFWCFPWVKSSPPWPLPPSLYVVSISADLGLCVCL